MYIYFMVLKNYEKKVEKVRNRSLLKTVLQDFFLT